MARDERVALVRSFCRVERRALVGLSALALAPALVALIQPLALKLLADNALGGRPLTGFSRRLLDGMGLADSRRALVVAAAALILATTLAGHGIMRLTSVGWERLGARTARDLSRLMFDRFQSMSMGFHGRNPSGDAMTRISTDSYAMYTTVNAIFSAPVTTLATLLVVGWSAWRTSPGLTMVMLSVVPVLAFVTRWSNRVLKQRAQEVRGRHVAVTAFVAQVVRSLPVVHAFGAETANLHRFRVMADHSRAAAERSVVAESSADGAMTIITALGTAAVLVLGGNQVLDNRLTLGDLLVTTAYLQTFVVQFRRLLGVGRTLRMAEVGLDRIIETLNEQDRIVDPPKPVAMPPRSANGASVVWREVVFGYEPGKPILDCVSFAVEPGEFVALVGRSGAGKTTLLSLVPRLFDPWSGVVEVDGVDVRSARLDAVRDRVALVRQHPLILPVSVADNIALGQTSASRNDIEWAARKAHVAEFIETLPDGYDTIMAEGGVTLSGGQRQLIAIARAFLKDAPILLMDEPTSALDHQSEAAVVASIDELAKGRTVLVIAHRLTTVARATRTVAMDDGVLTDADQPGDRHAPTGLVDVDPSGRGKAKR